MICGVPGEVLATIKFAEWTEGGAVMRGVGRYRSEILARSVCHAKEFWEASGGWPSRCSGTWQKSGAVALVAGAQEAVFQSELALDGEH